MGVAALNWWVWSTKVGMAAKFFACTLLAYYQASPYVNSWIKQWVTLKLLTSSDHKLNYWFFSSRKYFCEMTTINSGISFR